MTRPYHRWSEEEHEVLRASVGLPVRTIQRKLGHTASADALKQRYYELTGHSMTTAVEARGMTLAEVAAALGTTHTSVRRWRDLGTEDRLPVIVAYAARRERHLVKTTDLIAWVKCGTLAKWNFLLGGTWKPAPAWIGFVADAEQTWRATYISSVELRAMFAFVKTLPRNFPSADITDGGNQRPHWWKRAAVKAWLTENPRYLTAKVKAEL